MAKLKGYERYQLEWMIEHGYSLDDLFSRMDDIVDNTYHSSDRPLPSDSFENFEEVGFFGSEIWSCEEEWEDNDNKCYIEELLKLGIEHDIVKIIESPNDGCVACQIGEYWFYVIDSEDENMKPVQIKESYTCDELVELIYSAIAELDDTERNYYMSYIEECLNKQL